MTVQGDYVLAGYLRFVEPNELGVIAHVISKYAPNHAVGSDVPVFRLHVSGGGCVTKDTYESAAE